MNIKIANGNVATVDMSILKKLNMKKLKTWIKRNKREVPRSHPFFTEMVMEKQEGGKDDNEEEE